MMDLASLPNFTPVMASAWDVNACTGSHCLVEKTLITVISQNNVKLTNSFLPKIRATDSEIRSAVVEVQSINDVTFIKRQCLEVLELAQIPELDCCILCSSCEVVSYENELA